MKCLTSVVMIPRQKKVKNETDTESYITCKEISMNILHKSSTLPSLILCIVCACAIMGMFSPCLAADTDDGYVPSESVPPANMISSIAVTSLFVYPEVLAPFEHGTITITIQNIGTAAVQIESIGVDGKEISVINNFENKRTTIGGGDTREFTLSFTALEKEATYYPNILIRTKDSGYTRYPFSIKVEKEEAQISLVERSSPFNPGVETFITLQVANPRSNDIRVVQIRPIYDSEAFESITPNAMYIGDLAAGTASDAVFALTPIQDTTVLFVVEYMNGDNPHEVTYELPITLGQDKKIASPVLSNVMVTNMGLSYRVSGSISNAGLEDANGLILTSKSPATPAYPDKEYVVGVLKPNDFSRTFTITFEVESNVHSVPVLITYKDNSGNVHEIEYIADIPPPAFVASEGEIMQQPAQVQTSSSPLLIMLGCIIIILTGAYGIYRLVRWKPD